mmetsp:Transcript_24140/g.71851  ORF Transcript_24140/g.71851 Transcript_24140/m.71851 type:complete len:215 (-) Transcript_24140:1395-2039(-)
MREDDPKLVQRIHLALAGDEHEDGLLQLAHPCVGLHALDDADGQSRRFRIERVVREPVVLQAGGRIWPRVHVFVERLPEEVLADEHPLLKALVEPRLLVLDCLDRRILPPGLAFFIDTSRRWPRRYQGEVRREEVVENDPRTPDVNLRSQLLAEDLWRHVEQGPPGECSVLLRGVEKLRKTKVDDLDEGALPVNQHDVLRLQVLVHEAPEVHEG